ncbi:MAG: class I mannose-6-phosphate isomerase [Clostridia bacterium]|nr:class I mannose-6-phosphate isomerase [Clostridia bacterium]
MITPIKTAPVFKQYIWGGSALKDKYNKNIQDNFAAESWEISCHKDGMSLVAEGEFAGKTLNEVVMSDKENMLGDAGMEQFPLLVKLLDANDNLSVQVHPDDEYAKVNENGSLGKTEMWYVIDAKPGAKLVYGLRNGVTKQQFADAIEQGTLEELLNYVPVKPGDAFFIPSKTLHAIGSGLLIAEIQQSSNTTYRVYDYNRTDASGNKRELHTAKALDVTSLEDVEGCERVVPVPYAAEGAKAGVISCCEFFAVIKYELDGKTTILPPAKRFEMLVCTEGCAKLGYNGGVMDINAGDSVFIPAALGAYTLEGSGDILRSFVPADGEF